MHTFVVNYEFSYNSSAPRQIQGKRVVDHQTRGGVVIVDPVIVGHVIAGHVIAGHGIVSHVIVPRVLADTVVIDLQVRTGRKENVRRRRLTGESVPQSRCYVVL
jgi:hypothetical protein